MYQTPLISNRILLKFIIVIYILLFLSAIIASGYLLNVVIQTKPIQLINLLKYILLCFLFFILLANGIKALSLRPVRIQQLASGTKNFKWLFTITLFLMLLFQFDLIKTGNDKLVEINNLQISIVAILMLFCFWSDRILREQKNSPFDEINTT